MLKFFKWNKDTALGESPSATKKVTTKAKSSNDRISWDSTDYYSSVAQRNVLLLISIGCLFATAVSSFSVFKISYERTIEPFAVEIEKKSGVATLVDPMTVREYSAIESLNQFFLVEYIKARELFIPSMMEYNYYTKVRLLSSQKIYDEFRYWSRPSNPKSPINLYAQVVTGDLRVRSIQNIYPGTVQIRFGMEFSLKDGSRMKSDRIATISFQYISMNITEVERQVNPLGFQITYYKADDEFL